MHDTAHIIVASEVGNNAADVGQLLPMRATAAKSILQAWQACPTELVVALGRDGKRCAEVDAQKNPRTAETAAKLQTDAGKTAYR